MPRELKDGEYFVTHTLLASYERDPATGETRVIDCNRRHIERWPSCEVVLVLNPKFEKWTPEHEADLQRRLAELNANNNQETT